SGAADTVLLLRRRRYASQARLSVTGRDVDEQELDLTYDQGRWTLIGEADHAEMPEPWHQILDALGTEERSPADIEKLSGLSINIIKKALANLAAAKLVMWTKHGHYRANIPSPPAHGSDCVQDSHAE